MQGVSRLIKPPLTKPKKAAKARIPAWLWWTSRGNQNAMIDNPEAIATAHIVLNTPKWSEMNAGRILPGMEAALCEMFVSQA